MKANKYLIFMVIVSIVFLGFMLSKAQEVTIKEEAVPSGESEAQWLWGEVVSLDTQNNTFLIAYLDYETDSEKQITVNVDAKTTYENASGLVDIKPQDNVSIDYIISADGKNIAKNISLEKPEAGVGEAGNTTDTNAIAPEELAE